MVKVKRKLKKGKKKIKIKSSGAWSKHRACNLVFKEHLDDNYADIVDAKRKEELWKGKSVKKGEKINKERGWWWRIKMRERMRHRVRRLNSR